MKEDNLCQKLFSTLDFLSYKQSLCFNGNANYSTVLGSILSILIIASALGFSIYNLVEYVNRPNKYISENIINTTEQRIRSKEILLMFKYNAISKLDSQSKLVAENYFSTSLSLLIKSDNVESTFKLGFKQCEKTDFTDDYYYYLIGSNINISEYYCIKKSYDSQIIYLSSKANGYDKLHFTLNPCKLGSTKNSFFNKTETKCLYDYTKLENILNEYDLSISVVLPYDYCDHDKVKYPIIKRHREYIYTYIKGGFNLYTNKVQQFQYESDNGVIFRKRKKSVGYTSYESYGFYQNPRDNITYDTHLFNIYIESTSIQTKKYFRYYIKLQSYVADVCGVIIFMTLVWTIITYFLTEGLYFRDLALVPFEKGYFSERKNKIRCIRQKLGYEKVSASLYKHNGNNNGGLFELSEIKEKDQKKNKNEDYDRSELKMLSKNNKQRKDDSKRDKYLKANYDLISRINIFSSLGNMLFPCSTRDKKLNLLRSFKKFACYYLSADELVHNFMKYERLSGVALIKST